MKGSFYEIKIVGGLLLLGKSGAHARASPRPQYDVNVNIRTKMATAIDATDAINLVLYRSSHCLYV